MKALLTILSLICCIGVVSTTAHAVDCVTVTLFTEPAPDPADGLVLMLEAVHCGTGFATATLTYTVERNDSVYTTDTFSQLIPSGFVLTAPVPFPDPPLPAGTYRVCVEAAIGTASDVSCGNATLDAAGHLIVFILDDDSTPVDLLTWGTIKRLFR